MPRTYDKKRQCPAYTQEYVVRAVRDVENQNCTFAQAENYGVPRSVIFH